jgi:hypothetical protein
MNDNEIAASEVVSDHLGRAMSVIGLFFQLAGSSLVGGVGP